MTPSQLRHTQNVIEELISFKRPADAVLSLYFKNHNKLGRQDRHEIAETAFAALRHYEKIADFLGDDAKNPHWVALAALIIGRGLSINVLGDCITDEEKPRLSALKAHKAAFAAQLNTAAELPTWLVERLSEHLSDDDIKNIGKSLSAPAPLDLRVNTLKGKRDKVLKQLQDEGLDAVATPYSPWGIRLQQKIVLTRHPLFREGVLEVQDEGSQLLALLTGCKRGDMAVDFCAGAGGKTLAMGAMMANTGRVYAFDIAEKRLANMKPRLARSGLSNVHPELLAHENDSKIRRLMNKVDTVLVDAPCSGLGTLRRNPDLKYRQSPASVAQLLEQQASILESAARLLKLNGRLVYATCSILPEENQQQVARFLANHPNFELLDCAELLKGLKIPLNTGTSLSLNPYAHQTDGFFAAVLQKKSH
ncbi:RsmB/NOP family class I SAM-dependent RNA methyltransferase [Neisseriaceae bacterium CLB008]|nr:RsmB/NOP family class I SAM-dependent RNA methyltransferase [Neisseriaceae bacterium]